MGHGKETPRQKMIGMMYLVLTAMLALNVSKEVLNAFILVDEGLVTTTENFSEKNKSVYRAFDAAMLNNPTKTREWKERAEQVRALSDSLSNFVHQCKVDILMEDEEDAIHGGEMHWDEVQGKDNTDTPAMKMVNEGRATELKSKIEEYREYLLGMIEDTAMYSGTVHALEGILSTELPDVHLDHSKNVTPTWETTYFENLPLASVITLLSNFQANVRNAEAEILNYLLGQVEAGDLSVNAVEAVVKADRSLVFPGQQYRAQVFLAAYDSTKAPEVVLDNGTKLDVEGGKGVYTTTPSTLGTKTWGGVIKIDQDGEITSVRFNAEYEVAESNATISATAMNVFYRGLDNPVAISAGSVAESEVSVSITSPHSIRKLRPGSYVVKPGTRGDNATVTVYAEVDGQRKVMGSMVFRVLDLPTPIAKIEGSRGGQANLRVGDLVGLQIVEAEAEDFLFEVEFEVITFTMGFVDASGIWASKKSTGKNFTSDMKGLFRTMKPGQRITLQDIKASGPDGKVRPLSPINITVR